VQPSHVHDKLTFIYIFTDKHIKNTIHDGAFNKKKQNTDDIQQNSQRNLKEKQKL